MLNDVNGDLVNLYRVIKHHLEEFLRQFKWALSSRQIYEWTKDTPSQTLTDIQRAARFFYLQKLSFGGRVAGQTFGTATTSPPRLNLLRLEEDMSQAHLRLSQTLIEHRSWQHVVDAYGRDHTLFFCDPPYWETEGYGVDFELDQYVQLADAAKRVSGTMIITVNDHPKMREVFAGLEMRSVPITYTVGGADTPADRHELIIGNWNEWPTPRPVPQSEFMF